MAYEMVEVVSCSFYSYVKYSMFVLAFLILCILLATVSVLSWDIVSTIKEY